ncbi:MAG: 50S ribosomal protein L40e [Nanobdellota archaeon]
MSKFPEAEARLFKRRFVCKECKTKLKAGMLDILAKKIKCKNCGSRNLRVIKKK